MVEIGNMSLKLKIGLAALKYKSKKILKYIYNRVNIIYNIYWVNVSEKVNY